MSSTQTSSERATGTPSTAKVEMKLEVVVLPVSDVDRAKRFYGNLGWRLDADFTSGDDFRVVQLTPSGSQCSIHFGKGLTTAMPGSVQSLYLVVSDIEAARAELTGRGVNVSEPFHYAGTRGPRLAGPDPEGRSYRTYAAPKHHWSGWYAAYIVARERGRTPEEAAKDAALHMERARDRAQG